MKVFSADMQAHLDGSKGFTPRVLMLIEARDGVGDPVNIAMWTGDEDMSFTVDGTAYTFKAVRRALQIENLEFAPGLTARAHQVRLEGLPPVLEDTLRNVDLYLADIRAWWVYLNPVVPVGDPIRFLKGIVEDPVETLPANQTSTRIEFRVVTGAIDLTYSASRPWSNETQQRRADYHHTGTVTDIASDTVRTISGGIAFIELEIVGGGGEGAGPVGAAGSNGGETIVEMKDGTTIINTWTLSGGAGGSGVGVIEGEASPLTPSGDGGNGSAEPGVDYSGGTAGSYQKVAPINLSAIASPILDVIIGAGGGASGRHGTPGLVRLTEYTRVNTPDSLFDYTAIAAGVRPEWKA